MCGTSMASPTVCGLCALILQDFKVQFPDDPLPRNATLKVLLAHNAVDLGNTGPDYIYGYGSVRGRDTIDFMRTGTFLEDALDQSEDRLYLVHVLPGTGSLKVTMAWDDPPGAVNTIPELVNDLDLIAISPAGETTHYPWTLDPDSPGSSAVRTQPDRINNIEQVAVDNPEPGTWAIRVNGYSVPSGPQVFSIAATPDMLICSSAGLISLSSDRYACQSTATIRVNDCDLNLYPDAVESTTVTIRSTSEPGGESVLLTETKPNSATFGGTIALAEIDSPGVLRVAHGDIVTARYDDADDGTGSPAVVEDTAVIDCATPVVSNVTAADRAAMRATVTFDTDEPARAAVRYGPSCGGLELAVGEVGFHTSHTMTLTGLQPETPYFYAIEAEDQAGNSTTDDNGGDCHTFTTTEVQDYFTEHFSSDDNDLDDLALELAPDGSMHYYRACNEPISELPTDPAGGTTIPLNDDGSQEITLTDGKTVQLYGAHYPSFHVGSNGYVTFGSGDDDYSESLTDHFVLPRISVLFRDFNPSAAGTVSYRQLHDRAVVTWQNVPRYNDNDSNTFQVAMYFDGRIVMAWRGIDVTDGLVGLSAGSGVAEDFAESDVSDYGPCGSRVDFDHDGDVDMADFGHLQTCYTGPGAVQEDPDCGDARLDGDADVDWDDFSLFRQCLSGANVPADPNCPGE